MTLKVAQRGDISPFIVMEVMSAANKREATGGAVYHLEVGQPASCAPKGVIRAAQSALENHRLGYTEALGIVELRKAIARHYLVFYGIKIGFERIVVTAGSSAGFILSFLAAFDQGDRVAVALPGYPCYRNILSALGVIPVPVRCGSAEGFKLTPESLDRTQAAVGPIQGLIVASPANPTGTMLKTTQLEELCRYCKDHEIRLISDEIYHGITYEEKVASALEFTEEAIIVNSFSKYFSMTGWRLGWLVLPTDLMRPVECLSQNLYISPPTLSQIAAIAAFGCREELEANVKRYAENRALLLRELPKAGYVNLAPADGAFYIYADVKHLTDNSESFCRSLLARTGVAATPGIDFDPENGDQYIRFSFAGSNAEVAEAAEALLADRINISAHLSTLGSDT